MRYGFEVLIRLGSERLADRLALYRVVSSSVACVYLLLLEHGHGAGGHLVVQHLWSIHWEIYNHVV